MLSLLFVLGVAGANSLSRCEDFLGRTVQAIDPATGRVSFNLEAGVGPRGFLLPAGALDARSRAGRAAARQGAFIWGHAIGVRPSVEEARRHDAELYGAQKHMYLIADPDRVAGLRGTFAVDEAGLGPAEMRRRRDAVQGRWSELFRDGAARVFWFKDSVETEIPPETARRVFHPLEMGFVDADGVGGRFYQLGWFFPRVRGVHRKQKLFARKETGGLQYKTIKDALKLVDRLTGEDGFTYTMNTDFQETLDVIRTVRHDRGTWENQGREPIRNSSFQDPQNYEAALAAHAAGEAFTLEFRKGGLWGGLLGTRGEGGLVWFDTIFSLPENKTERMKLLKMLSVTSSTWMIEGGYPFVDLQIVSSTTVETKAEEIPGQEFLEGIRVPAPDWSRMPASWSPPKLDR